MAMQCRLIVSLQGGMSRAKLDALRRLLEMERRGRLDDQEDVEFGYRYLQERPNTVRLYLIRDDDTHWRVKLTHEKEPPPAGTVEALRSAILSAAAQLGFTTERVWEPAD